MIWKLPVEVLLDVFDAFGIRSLLQQLLVEARVALHEQLAPAQVEPGAGAHRGGDALAAALPHLTVVAGHERLPVIEHADPLLLTPQDGGRRHGLFAAGKLRLC